MKNRKSNMKRHMLSFAATMALVLGGGMQLYAAEKLADTVYHNGKIYTVTETMEEAKDVKNAKKAEVVATLNGKIVFVGTELEATKLGYFDDGKVNKIVDLRGKTMLPGFVDGHGHFPSQGNNDLFKVNLNSPLLDGPADTMDKLVEELKKKADTLPAGSPIIGFNYDDTQLAEQRHPSREDLDKASTTHPILISHISGHMSVANSAALEKYGITKDTVCEGLVKDPATGEPTGLLLEMKAQQLVPLGNELKVNDARGVARASEVYAAAGVTTADSGGVGLSGQIPLLQGSIAADELDLRVVIHPMAYYLYTDEKTGISFDAMGPTNRQALGWKKSNDADPFTDGSDALQAGADLTSLNAGKDVPENLPANQLLFGAWKIIFDGSPQGYTAWMKKPGFYDWDEYTADHSFDKAGYFNGLEGTLNMTVDALKQTIKLYHANGQSTETHTNGSGAAEAWITAVEEAVAAAPDKKDTRHTSIHGQTLERQHIQRMVGDYAGLEGTADMYEELEGAFKDGVVDTTLGGKLPAGNLGELMKAQNNFVSFFNNHTYFYGYRHTNKFFGPGRAYNMSPAGWATAYGLPYSFHNDTFVTPISPLRSIQSGVTRFSGDAIAASGQENIEVNGTGKDLNAKAQYKARITDKETRDFWTYDQRVNTLQALRAVTIMPAWQNKVEDRIGSIEVGKLADFTIMDKDVFEVAETAPRTIADLRVAATIVGDKVVHGMLPDGDVFVSSFRAAYDQPTLNTEVTMIGTPEFISHADAEKDYASLNEGEKRFGTVKFSASVEPESSAVFQMTLLGNGDKLSNMKLYKLTATEKFEYEYGRPDAGSFGDASGQWWIADFANPTVALSLDDDPTLETDKQYLAFFVIRDNDGRFDVDDAEGVITDPVTLVSTTGALPNNGGTADHVYDSDSGSSSGCTVGSTPAYDLLVLFLGFSAIALIRVARRRNS
ncbi:amidohydrolase [uncultured Bilophila sp.]|nr:amidohydrolase [uncultured Bilophila sp.]